MTNNATGYCTQNRTGNAVLILHWRTMSDGYIAAFLTRCFDGFFDRRCGKNLRVLRTGRKNIKTGHRSNTQSGCNTNTHTG
ncbi:hypothetical protein D3C80_1806380 [compost metagenome]